MKCLKTFIKRESADLLQSSRAAAQKSDFVKTGEGEKADIKILLSVLAEIIEKTKAPGFHENSALDLLMKIIRTGTGLHGAVLVDLKVAVVTEGIAGIADIADDIALVDPLAPR